MPEDTPKVPIARVKRIIKQDDDVVAVSNSAVYAVAAATELFTHYFTEQAYLNAQSDKRKALQYGDFANAVANVEQLEFLSDLVPKKVPFKKVVERKKTTTQVDKNQTTLGMSTSGSLEVNAPKSLESGDEEEDEDRDQDRDQDGDQDEDQDGDGDISQANEDTAKDEDTPMENA